MRRCWLVLILAGCTDLPFTFVVKDSKTLLKQEFASYDEGEDAGPFTVIVTNGSTSEPVTVSVGICEGVHCAGPITVEAITLTLSPNRPDHVLVYYCEGLYGTYSVGIDSHGSGGCD